MFCGDSRVSNPQKWVEHRSDTRNAVEFDTILRESDGKRGRMRSFLGPTLNCFVGNEPSIAAAACVAPARVRPARDVALVLVRHAEREPVDANLAGDSEMKNVFVAVVQKSLGTDRLKMSKRSIIDCDRFDPMNRVLQNEQIAQLKNNFVRKHRI